MAINVADNFSYKGGKPLDARIKYDTITAMVNTPTADLYDGCFAYVTAEKKNYQYDSSNAVDPTLGKWREFEGGGSGGGHTIEDSDGTALTQRDTLKFGEGFAVSDDSTNEKTVVNLDPMPDTDMSDVIDPLPSVTARKCIIKNGNIDCSGSLAKATSTQYNVTFSSPMPTTDYSVVVSRNFLGSRWALQDLTVWSKTINGFKVSQYNSSTADAYTFAETDQISWIAIYTD